MLPIADLGRQSLTGWFPRSREEHVPVAPLQLVKCDEDKEENCGLLQLRHSCDPSLIYGERYGYRSGLNSSMRSHLARTVLGLRRRLELSDGDAVVDIGSNDGTLLGEFERGRFCLIGIDPTANKFRSYYRDDIEIFPEFFDAKKVSDRLGGQKAKLITSLAMFYDLEKPLEFMCQVGSLLCRDGMWFIEQSYMPSMIARTAYDTVCHEHLEYYRLKQINWMAIRAGLKIIDVTLNEVNGGSFAVLLARDDAPYSACAALTENILRQEAEEELQGVLPYAEFEKGMRMHRRLLIRTIGDIRRAGGVILGYGASTKGNVLLQYCGLGPSDITAILEVNEDKFGCFTPGTGIPIVDESVLGQRPPDYLLVLPWHFKRTILRKEYAYLQRGGRMIFPLPEVNVVASQHKADAALCQSASHNDA